MVADRASGRRIPPISKANSPRKCAFQLALFTDIDDNGGQTGASGARTPPVPHHNGGISSAMMSSNSTATTDSPQPRKTYPQDWRAYNAAQTSEKPVFMGLLADLCGTVEQPTYEFGRPRLPISDMLFACAFKVYSGFSSRRFNSDVVDAYQKGFIDAKPSYASVNRYMANPALTANIKALIELSALPLAAVESNFAADATGFSTSRFDRWYSAKWGREKAHRRYVKAHMMCGVKTNIVTAITVTEGFVHDSRLLPELIDTTAKGFTMAEVSADKGYLSIGNFEAVTAADARPFIPFKSNTTGKGSPLWEKLYAQFILHREEWDARYHLRSNSESVFSACKAKFGDSVRSTSETGQINETLLKFLCHNICVLNQEMNELGITPSFDSEVRSDSNIIDLSQYR